MTRKCDEMLLRWRERLEFSLKQIEGKLDTHYSYKN